MLLLILFLLVAACLASAQPGSIEIFADPFGAICDFVDAVPGLVFAYAVHVYTPGATSARFAVVWETGMRMAYLGETVTPPYYGVGNSRTGILISYGSCVTSPNMILTYSFFAHGTSDPCSYIFIVPIPDIGIVQVEDCASPPNLLSTHGGCAPINDDGSCPCVFRYCPPPPVPVEQSSWGQIKSLYR
jgi:hypothetical protein